MTISFRVRKLQKICNSGKEMRKAFGKKMAIKLKQRLLELNAADTLADISKLPPPRCHELTGKEKGCFSVDLEHPYRLIFAPVALDNINIHLDDGGFNLSKITEIEILEIRDTHDKRTKR